ncbi:hypothetical protein CK203_031376 [Vitis vinifera]|uniref:RING-type E3 ubiquitin transferase n=1 Tax=Vitis vinifera TaxID=29760 RepID=A0A438I8V4_VITVI|nr:hypothetical protein CK203_031376 [Vitis vinifera]
MTLVGEGWWDVKKNQIYVAACQILNTTNFLAIAHVGGCSIRGKAWGYSEPLFVGDKFCDPYKYAIPVSENSRSSVPISTSMPANSEVEANAGDSSLLNISYKISFNLEPGAEFGARLADEEKYALWVAERNSLYQQHSHWQDLRPYASMQRFGGHFILPKGLKELETYEKVTVVCDMADIQTVIGKWLPDRQMPSMKSLFHTLQLKSLTRHHCDSIVPESTPTSPEFTSSLLPRSQTGYSIGPDTTVEGRLRLFLPWSLKYSQLSYPHLQGFWSESSGKLCMVGSGSSRSREVSGTLESLSSVNDFDYFEPITILLFPQMNYKYTLVPEENDTGSTGRHNVPERSSPDTGLITGICSILRREVIQCSEYERRSLVLVKFQSDEHYQPFHPNMTLVGEGWWDAKKSRLSVVACRLSNLKNSLANAQVGDCSVRLSLRFNTIWSIRNMSMMLGQIWSNKTVNESGYFERIAFQSTQNVMLEVRGFKYEYTETDRARSLCQIKKPAGNKGLYKPYQYAMPLSINSKSSVPVSRPMPANRVVEANTSNSIPMNISYKISFMLEPGVEFEGCRKLSLMTRLSTNDSMDCEILVNFQFPPLNSKKGHIKGTIKSRREKSDPLYFEHLDLSSTSYTVVEAKQSIWRMDLEIFMVLISNTLSCVFLGLQLFYVKNQPDVLPSISLLMLVILTLGYMVPLVLNFEALFLQNHARQNVLLESGGWLKVNEVIVRVVTMVVFLLQFRLLQLTWSAKCGAENQKGLWDKDRIWCCEGPEGIIKPYQLPATFPLAGLEILCWLDPDGFLFPQIILNMFISSRDEPLLVGFIWEPPLFDCYLTHTIFSGLITMLAVSMGHSLCKSWCRLLLNLLGCHYSLCGSAVCCYHLLAAEIGGRCILPRRFKDLEAYEKVPVASSE